MTRCFMKLVPDGQTSAALPLPRTGGADPIAVYIVLVEVTKIVHNSTSWRFVRKFFWSIIRCEGGWGREEEDGEWAAPTSRGLPN